MESVAVIGDALAGDLFLYMYNFWLTGGANLW